MSKPILRLDISGHPQCRDLVLFMRQRKDCVAFITDDESSLLLMDSPTAERLAIFIETQHREADSSQKQGVKQAGRQRFDRTPTSKFVGVSRCANGEWRAEISHLGKPRRTVCLSETGAARQYDAWAIEIFGPEAKTNVSRYPYIGIL